MNQIYKQPIIYSPWRENYCTTFDNTQQTPSFAPPSHKASEGFRKAEFTLSSVEGEGRPEKISNKPCVFCHISQNNDPNNDTKNLVLHRGKHSYIILASQPYISNGIHFLIIPYEHKRELRDLSRETYDEENMFTQKLCALFASNANETYINSNQGIAAGASIPEHHHRHVMIKHAPNFYNLIHAIQETKKTVDLPALFQELQPKINKLEHAILPQQPLHKNFQESCYHCSIIQKNDQENLIIHRGTYATVMLSHHPKHFGEIDIIPNNHFESLETMPAATYDEINTLTIAIYPLMLKLVNAQDSNIGLLSYGSKAKHKKHIRQRLIPRKDSWRTTPITESNHMNGDIEKFYKILLLEWIRLLSQQRAKL